MKILMFIVVLMAFLLGVAIYPQMPELMASHWGFSGQVNGYMTRFWGVFLMPIISLLMLILFWFLPKIDPMKKNIVGFKRYYEGFVLATLLFLFYIYFLTIQWNLGMRFNLIKFMAPAFAGLFYLAGILIAHAKRNWFIGIRTPWTLSSDKVWDKTHKLGGHLFKACAGLSLIGYVLPEYALWLILIPVLLSSVYLFYYSYLEFKKI